MKKEDIIFAIATALIFLLLLLLIIPSGDGTIAYREEHAKCLKRVYIGRVIEIQTIEGGLKIFTDRGCVYKARTFLIFKGDSAYYGIYKMGSYNSAYLVIPGRAKGEII